jgi:stress-induced morphogen
MMDEATIEKKITSEIEDAQVKVADLTDQHAEDGGHFRVIVVSEEFEGKPQVKQHQRVYNALSGDLDGEDAPIHALGLQTYTPEEYETMAQSS